MKKRIIVSVCLVLAGVLATLGTAGYRAFLRPPANPPSQACGDERGDRPVVVAAGASITQGTLGGDWVGALRARPELQGYEFVNAGVNGNTSADLLGRIDTDVMACRPAAVTILVGTNDVRDGVPVDRYQDNMAAIVERITAGATARVALMSLPPLGEELDSEINRNLSGYNAAIREVAIRAGVDYVPVHERMTGLLAQRGDRQPYDFSFPLALSAATQHYVLGRNWDEVARAGGRELLVDHIHLSDRGAAQVADLAAEWLTRTQAQ
ncbi:SGNH/GDSL hydrolase family protein [Micromonospora sp. H33]|uniref:SGNH/GDSL hydrolase family protein n=1 Tax=Micromonospora sp. H33 TaxID=3452215 RepID=UPI003F8AF8CD